MRIRLPAALLAGVAMLAAGCSRGDGSSTQLVPKDPSTLVGTCLDVPADVPAEVASLPKVSCDEPHTHEIYWVGAYEQPAPATGTTAAVKDLPYPGEQVLTTFAEAACHREFGPEIGEDPLDSRLFYSFMIPTLASWNETPTGDRTIICVVGDPTAEGGKVQGSLRGATTAAASTTAGPPATTTPGATVPPSTASGG